ncbi:MAG: glycosyltransferase family 39 protein [Tepidisphaeraceae bacterium]|jgi:4-amino-4-deoxy-L-arabinose transferase-like glycosyltransferase
MSNENAKYRWGTALAVVLLLGVYLAGNNRAGLWDRDEPRYAQTSKQMLLNRPSDWVVPRLLGDVRTAKPIFIYWCQAASMKLLGPTDFAARLPSALGMAGTLALMGLVTGRWLGWKRGFWTVVVLGTSGLAIAAGKMCITDAVLLFWVTLAQVCLCAIYLGNGDWRVAVVLWVAAGMAVLTKGPVVMAVSGMTLFVLAMTDVVRVWSERRWAPPAADGQLPEYHQNKILAYATPKPRFAWWRQLEWLGRTRPHLGLLIVVLICGPWLVMVHLREPTFLPRAIGHEIVHRASKALEGHKGPPGYYLATIWGTFMPWSLLLIAVLVVAWRNRRRPVVRFSLAAIIGPWLLLELVQTKLAHYILPVFPPLALLTADLVVRCVQSRHNDLTRRLNVVPVSIWSLAVAAAGFAGFAGALKFSEYRQTLMVPSVVLAALGVVWAAVVWVLWLRKSIERAMLSMAAGMVVVLLWVYLVYLPRAGFMWLPQQIGEVLHREGATRAGDVGMIDYQEDSLYWYQGGTIAKPDDDYFRITPQQSWSRWIVLPADLWRKLPANVHAEYEEIARRHGLAYADRMKVLDVVVIRRRSRS